METNTSFLIEAQPTTLLGILISLLGFILYWGVMILKKKSEKKESFMWEIWWVNNWFNLALSLVACLAVFIATYASNALTYDRCLMIGTLGSFIIDRLKKTIE